MPKEKSEHLLGLAYWQGSGRKQNFIQVIYLKRFNKGSACISVVGVKEISRRCFHIQRLATREAATSSRAEGTRGGNRVDKLTST